MNIGLLRTFISVAEHLSFSSAAQQRHRSQPAISRQITVLEESLGVKLFERGTRHVQLTGAGRELLARAARLVGECDELTTRMASLAAGKVGTIRIGTTPVSIEGVVAPILSKFVAKWKHVELVLVQDTAASLFHQVESGSLDVAVSRFATTDVLCSKCWFPTYVVALVPPTHRFAKSRKIDIGDLEGETLLLGERDSGSRILVDHAFKLDGLQPRRILLESPVIRELAVMAEAQLGVAIVLSSISLTGLNVLRIPVYFRGKPLGTWAAAIWSRARELPDFAEDFIRMGAAMMRTGYPGHELRVPKLPEPGLAEKTA